VNDSTPVIIPALQAEDTIGDVVKGARQFSRHVVVIDDGSIDNTGKEATLAGAEVLRHPLNLGKGRALQTGFDHLFAAGYEQVVTMDADGQHLAEEIPKLLDGMQGGADLVIGSRSMLFAGMHGVRLWSNTISSTVISAVAGEVIEDVQSGFRLYTRRLLLATGFREARFEAESAVVVRAARRNLKIHLVPIRLGFVDGRRTSHYRPLVDSLRIAVAVTRARFDSFGVETS
jgi:glycosyltransferase involved in cell wall biosynthesis